METALGLVQCTQQVHTSPRQCSNGSSNVWVAITALYNQWYYGLAKGHGYMSIHIGMQ